jgi:ketosteroid isomerase-like protein
MKNLIYLMALVASVVSCSAPVKEETPAPDASTVSLPYTASYSSQSNQDVSDTDLLNVLNSYKAWENGDMTALRSAMADTISFNGWNGTVYIGPTEGLLSKWGTTRDSLSSVKIDMAAWVKVHSIDKNADFVNVWYKEIDTYKTGKVDSADWHDINMVANGKIVWYSQYRRAFKAN